MCDILQEKLKEVAEFAEQVGDQRTQSVLLVLMGAREANLQELLARMVSQYGKDVLIPIIEDMENQARVKLN